MSKLISLTLPAPRVFCTCRNFFFYHHVSVTAAASSSSLLCVCAFPFSVAYLLRHVSRYLTQNFFSVRLWKFLSCVPVCLCVCFYTYISSVTLSSHYLLLLIYIQYTFIEHLYTVAALGCVWGVYIHGLWPSL